MDVKKCSSKKKTKVLLRVVHSAKKTKSVAICFSFYSEFQILDLDTGELSKTPFTLLGDGGIGTIVSIGSVNYTLGTPRTGTLDPDYSFYFSNLKAENDIVELHEGMSYFDLTNPQMGWRKCPLFVAAEEDKYIPNCVSLCGKLYVFRSSRWSCFGEVFDPNLNNSWVPLPIPIPFSGRKFQVSAPLVSDPLRSRILVHLDLFAPFASSIYAYYPAAAAADDDNDATWECIVEKFEGQWIGPVVFVDGVIYFYNRKSMILLKAYDLDTKQWLNVVLSSDFGDYSQYVFHSLHHLGNGLLCFTTYFYNLRNLDPSIEYNHTCIMSVQFNVQRHSDEVLLTPVSTKSSAFQSCCEIYGHIAI